MKTHRVALRTLELLLGFIAASALYGGIMLIKHPSGWAGLSLSLLESSPFRNYVLPGAVLFALVGGLALIATVALLRDWITAPSFATLASATLIGYIVVEALSIRIFHPLQALMFCVGLVSLFLARYLRSFDHTERA